MPTKHRAEPLSPEDRRRSIVNAVIPLILDEGSGMSTAQIARAAGIAEGTIFKVFPDKHALMFEAFKTCLDPAESIEQLEAIETDLDLASILTEAAQIINERSARLYALVSVLRTFQSNEGHHKEAHDTALEANGRILDSLIDLIASKADELSVTPRQAAIVFRGLLHAMSSPFSDPSGQVTIEETIEILLRGIGRSNGDHR